MMIPTFGVRDIRRAVAFYTDVLDFSLAHVMTPEKPFYAVLYRGSDELHVSLPTRRDPGGQSAIVVCEDVDGLFSTFQARGLKPSTRTDSPVHQGPLDQNWGAREVYIDDPDGNTLCFQQR
jgi:catechol 2,3-dioxygenase-like lactoylglutathione lyase family enzyme